MSKRPPNSGAFPFSSSTARRGPLLTGEQARHLLNTGVRYLGNWLEYNEPAAKDAAAKTRAFLAAHLGGTSPGEPTAK